MSKSMKPRYSGNKSKKFWKTVNSLPHPKKSEAYSLGVVLQNIEGDILRQIDIMIMEAENEKA